MISIIILTANRRPQLAATLAALEGQRNAPPWSAVILDNASTDDTPAWLLTNTRPHWKIVRIEPSQPYAQARNRAVAESDGDIIAFLDDDCVPEPEWLAALTAPFAEGFDAVGGVALPAPDHKPPSWWDARMNWIVGLTPPLPPDDREGARIYPSTSNMAVRRKILEVHPFQEIAPAAWTEKNAYLFGREDAEAWRRWRLAGARTVWAPGAVVRHNFHQGRYRWEYVKGRAGKDGRSFWRRRPAAQHLEKAWYDVLDFPRAAIKANIQYSRTPEVATKPRSHPGAYEFLWACRQWGVIAEAGRPAAPGAAAPPNPFEKLPGILARYVVAQGKAASRPVVAAALKALRPKPSYDEDITGIALVCCGFLGDCVLIAPLAQALRRRFPNQPLHLVTLPNGAALYSPPENRLFHSIVTVPSRSKRLMAARVKEVFAQRDINLVVFTYCHLDDPQEFLLQRARTIGWDSDAGFPRRLHYSLLDMRVPKIMTRPEMRNLAALHVGLGGDDALPFFKFTIPNDARQKARAIMQRHGLEPGRFITLHPGAGYPAKQWTPDGWAAIGQSIAGDMARPCAFIGGDDMKGEVGEWIAARDLSALNLCGDTDIWTMAALVAESALLVTTDSGPKHLAMALGAPTVTLYGASDENRWGAWREPEKHVAVRAFHNRLTGEEKIGEPDNIEMRSIAPEIVIRAIEDSLVE